MAVLKLSTPGVYVQEIPTFPPSVAEVETAIPAFIGYTEKAARLVAGDLLMLPTKIESFSEYKQLFGGAMNETAASVTIGVTDHGSNQFDVGFTYTASARSKFNLYYSMLHFFDNGGGTCYIVSVGTYSTDSHEIAAFGSMITTVGNGASGTGIDHVLIEYGLDRVKDIDEVTLLAVPESAWAGTAGDPTTGYNTIVQKMIGQAFELKDRFAIIDPYKVTPKAGGFPSGDIDNDVAIIRTADSLDTEHNSYAAAYYPRLITTYEYSYDIPNLVISSIALDAGAAPSLASAVVANNGDPAHVPPIPPTAYTVPANLLLSHFSVGSVFYNSVRDALKTQHITLPPSPAIAGLYTSVDANKGVWKAPANEPLLSVVAPSIDVSNRQQESLNIDPTTGKSINVIRTFPGFGTLVWGARTLNGNDNEWRYISVRRFFNMVEESIKKSTQLFVFAPNTIDTWVKVQAMIENYLLLKWKQGALAGVKPEQAFYVKVGLGTTMTSMDVLAGVMNVEIGMAVARPAEFIVLTFKQILQQS